MFSLRLIRTVCDNRVPSHIFYYYFYLNHSCVQNFKMLKYQIIWYVVHNKLNIFFRLTRNSTQYKDNKSRHLAFSGLLKVAIKKNRENWEQASRILSYHTFSASMLFRKSTSKYDPSKHSQTSYFSVLHKIKKLFRRNGR